MASRTVSIILTGNNASAVRAIEGTSTAAAKAGGVVEAKLGGAAGKVGKSFNALAAQAASFGVPFASTIGRVGTTFEQVEGKSRSFGSTIGKIGQVEAAAAAVGLVALGTESIHLADALEQAHAREVTATTNAGQSYGDYSDKIAKTSQQMEKFGFTNADTESSIANLTNATHDTGKAVELQGLAADVARGRNIDLATATTILMKVETGHVALLGRLGINVKDAAGNIISQEEAIRRLSATYQGQAAASADTFAGKMRTLSTTAQDLGAKLGEAIVPGVEAVATALSTGVTKSEDFNHTLDGVPGKITAIALAAPIAVAAIEKLDTVLGAKAVFGGALAGFAAPVAAVAAGVVGGFEAIRAAEHLFQKDTSQTAQGTKDLATTLDLLAHSAAGAKLPAGLTTGLGDNFEKLAHQIKTADTNTTGFLGRASDSFQKLFGAADVGKEKIVQTKNALIDLFKVDPKAAILEFGRISAALIKSGVSAQLVGSDFHDFTQLWGNALPAAAKTSTAAVFDLGTAFDELASKTGAIGKADELATIADKFDAINTAQAKVAADKADIAGTSKTARDADRAEADAVRGLRDANQAVSDSHQRLSDSYSSLQDAQDRVKTSARSLLEAQQALDEFNSPRGARERTLQVDIIQRRVASSPIEGNQKQLDLLKFADENAQKQQSLTDAVTSAQKGYGDALKGVDSAYRGIADAERGVQDATQKVADAQQGVQDAVARRKAVHDDAAKAIAGDERKVSAAVSAVVTELEKAKAAQQIGNTELGNYITLLDDVAKTADPGGPLSKALDSLIGKMQLSAVLGQAAKDLAAASLGPAGPAAPTSGTSPVSAPPAPVGPGGSSGYPVRAEGGPVAAHTKYKVGEVGPELFVAKADTAVSQAALAASVPYKADAVAVTAATALEAQPTPGPVDKMAPRIVGAKGPEIFVPPVAGTIIPHDKLAQTAAGVPLKGYAGGGTVDPKKPIVVGEKGPEIFVPRSAGAIVSNTKVTNASSVQNFATTQLPAAATAVEKFATVVGLAATKTDEAQKATAAYAKAQTVYNAERATRAGKEPAAALVTNTATSFTKELASTISSVKVFDARLVSTKEKAPPPPQTAGTVSANVPNVEHVTFANQYHFQRSDITVAELEFIARQEAWTLTRSGRR